MRNKATKMIISIILIISIIYAQTPVIYATSSLAGAAQAESDRTPTPPPPTPSTPSTPSTPTQTTPPDSETGTPNEPEVDRVATEYVSFYTGISGNAYEEIGEIYNEEILPNGYGQAPDSSRGKLGAPGITVQLLNSSGSVVASTVTANDGSYSFSGISAGTYKTRFVCGKIEESDLNSIANVRQKLKYNGHDYIVVGTPSGNYIDITRYEISASRRGCAQVILAVDCSWGMVNTEITVNGRTKSRLQVVCDAAKKLVDSLIDSGENIWISLVFYTGTNYRACGLTKNKQVLKQHLDYISGESGWRGTYTDMVLALNKATDSFVNNDANNSNRYIILLSDGIPTKAKDTKVYSDETEEKTLSKLKGPIKQSTIERVRQVKESGVKVISLFVKSEDNEENQLVEDIFKNNSSQFMSVEDGEMTARAISEDIKNEVIESTETREYSNQITILAGYEDSGRRQEIDNNFKGIFYYNSEESVKTSLFKMIQEYNASESSKEKAKELSNLSYMTITGGSGYVMNGDGVHSGGDVEEITNEDGEVVKRIIYQELTYTDQNLTIAQRPATSLVINTTATGLKITLSNGSSLNEQTVRFGDTFPVQQCIDDELSHGATIEVEYTISIKNESIIRCEYLELVDYVPINFKCSLDKKLLTENKTNKQAGWISITPHDLYEEGHISQETFEECKSKDIVKLVLDNDGKGKNGFYIESGGEYTVKIMLSTVISSLYDIRANNENVVEILGYKGESGGNNRRMAYTSAYNYPGRSIMLSYLTGVYPGDNRDKDHAVSTNRVIIIPPTGAYKVQYNKINSILNTLKQFFESYFTK